MPGQTADSVQHPAGRAAWRERRALWALGLLAAGLMIGRYAGGWLPGSGWMLAAAGVGAGMGAAVRGWACRATLGTAVIALGAGWFVMRCDETPGDSVARLMIGDRSLIEVECVALAAPESDSPTGGPMARFARRPGGGWRADVEVLRVRTAADAWEPASGVLRVSFGREPPLFDAGDVLRLRGFGAPLRPAMNPGEPDRERLARQRGVAGTLSVPSRAFAGVVTGDAGPVERVSASVRRWSRTARSTAVERLREGGSDGAGESSQLLAALLIGYGDGELRDLSGAFTRVGLAHIISVSGMNLSLLAWFCLLGLRVLGDRPRLEKLITAGVVLLFLLVVPAQAPILRAALMLAVFLGAEWGGRRYDRLNTLAWSAFVSLLWRPMDLWSVGFQLSYLGVAALLELSEPVRRGLFGERPVTEELGRGLRGWLLRRSEQVKTAFSASLCAWGVCTPAIIFHTGVFSAIGPVATLIVTPLVTAISGLGYLTLLVSTLVPATAHLASPALLGLSGALAWIVRTLDLTPGVVWWLPRVSAWWALAATVSVAWWMYRGRSRTGRARAGRWAVRAGLLMWLVAEAWVVPALTAPRLRLDALSIPGGACHVIRAGNGAVMYDCGSAWTDAGRLTIPRALRALGVSSVPAVVISHADLSRYSALPDLVEPLGVREVWVGEQLVQRAADVPEGPEAFVLAELSRRGVAVKTVAAGDRMSLGLATVEVVSPPRGVLMDSLRDASLVVRVREGTGGNERSILMLGERRDKGLRALREERPELRAGIVQGPSAGRAARRPSLLGEWFGAEVMVACGVRGPAPAGVASTGSGVFVDTARRGAVSAWVDGLGRIGLRTVRPDDPVR